jgi:hypothetical protein
MTGASVAKEVGSNVGMAIAEALKLGDPNEISRIVIDIRSDGAIVVHVERYAVAGRMLEVAHLLEGVSIKVKEVASDG